MTSKPALPRTFIRNIDWLIAWDDASDSHVYLKGADLVFDREAIRFVGKGYQGLAETVIEGAGRFILPGFVNIHAHPTSEPLLRGLTEERKSRQLGMSTLYEYSVLVGRSSRTLTLAESQAAKSDPNIYQDDEGRAAAAKLAFSEMLLSGVTTIVDYSPNRAGWVEEMAGIGIRACVAPSFRSGYWYTPNGHEVLYKFDEPAGIRAFEEAMGVLDEAAKHPSGRISGMVAPGQIDTCAAELLTLAKGAAKERGLPMQIHASQSIVEFREMVRRHGMTPLEWLESLGLLGPNFIVAHSIFIDQHSTIRWPMRDERDGRDRGDMERLAETGTSIAHCPNQFARGGVVLESFGKYRKRGINIGIGTDTHPHNFLDELRWAAILSKVADQDIGSADAASVFHAGTVGGARCLLRDDLGRLAVGAKPDLFSVDVNHPMMQPARDPLRGLLFSAQDRAVRDVWVGGEKIVADGEVLTIDVAAEAAKLNAAQSRALADVPRKDWAGRSADEAFPLALAVADTLSNAPPTSLANSAA